MCNNYLPQEKNMPVKKLMSQKLCYVKVECSRMYGLVDVCYAFTKELPKLFWWDLEVL